MTDSYSCLFMTEAALHRSSDRNASRQRLRLETAASVRELVDGTSVGESINGTGVGQLVNGAAAAETRVRELVN